MRVRTGRRGRHGGTGRVAAAAVLAVSTLLTACGSDVESGPPTLNWYFNNNLQVPVGERCEQESNGRYTVNPVALPQAASGQREQLLRRLAASDSSIDLMSLDPPFMAEFANAGFLRVFTDEEREEFTEGVLEGPLEQAIFDGQLYSAPWYGNTQLLWYYKSIAEQTGVDPAQGPVTWEQLIDAASRAGKSVAAQGRRNESLMVWVNALVQSAGGTILDPNSQGQPAERVEPTIDSPAGEAAARIMRSLADSPAAPPAFSTAGEEESRALFQSEDGAYMVNWTYVWAAFDSAIAEGTLPEDFKDDIGWARYPRVDADRESAPPSGGIGLSVGAFSLHPELTVELIRCLTSVESEKQYMLTSGDPAAKSAVYDDPAVREAFPMADDIRESINDAGPRPISPYYGDVTSAVQRGFHPPDAIVPATTPQETAALLKGVLTNQQLL